MNIIPSELNNHPQEAQAVYQLTTAQVIRAIIALMLTVVIVWMLVNERVVPNDLWLVFGLVVGSYFDLAPQTLVKH